MTSGGKAHASAVRRLCGLSLPLAKRFQQLDCR
jgi:hypothetical protein